MKNVLWNTHSIIKFVSIVSVSGIAFLSGCASNEQYCGIEYSDNYDIAKGILPYPSTHAPAVVVPYTYKDLKNNPYYYPPQPDLGCINYAVCN
jgi:hypothetical protein